MCLSTVKSSPYLIDYFFCISLHVLHSKVKLVCIVKSDGQNDENFVDKFLTFPIDLEFVGLGNTVPSDMKPGNISKNYSSKQR